MARSLNTVPPVGHLKVKTLPIDASSKRIATGVDFFDLLVLPDRISLSVVRLTGRNRADFKKF
jgi:hypothetical protein